jgi:hypothetical protein
MDEVQIYALKMFEAEENIKKTGSIIFLKDKKAQ